METACRNIIDHFIETTPKRVYKELVKKGFKQKAFTIATLTRMVNQAVNERSLKIREAIIDSVKEHCAILRLKELRKNQLAVLKVGEGCILQT